MKNTLRAVIIDDERLARNEMRSLLAEHPQVEVVAEAADVASGVAMLNAHHPDVLFLDIKLGRESGFDLLERLGSTPKVVFITAYDQYALRAFEINALDYLLKPVNPVRLKKTIRRLTGNAPPAR